MPNSFQQLNQYRDYLLKSGISPATLERKMSSVRAYLSFLEGKQSPPLTNKTINNEDVAADYITRLAALGIKAEIKQPAAIIQSSPLSSRKLFHLPLLSLSIAVFIFALGIGAYGQYQNKGRILGSQKISPDFVSPLSTVVNVETGQPVRPLADAPSLQIKSSDLTGTALIPSGSTEIKIESPYVFKESLVYLTPIGSTTNQVLYIKELNYIEKTITIGFDREIDRDLKFNWLIIN